MPAHLTAATQRHAESTPAPRPADIPQRYDLILTGRTLPYFAKAEVSAALSRVLRIAPPLAARLLLGRGVTLRSKIDQDLAVRCARTLLSIGAECRVQPSDVAAAPAAPVQPRFRPDIKPKAPPAQSAVRKLAPTPRPAPAAAQPVPAAPRRAVDLRIAVAADRALPLPIIRLALSAVYVTLLPVLYLALVVATGATLQWHALAHLHWLDSTLPVVFPISYAGLLLACFSVFALLLKPLVAPCLAVFLAPQHTLRNAPGLIAAAAKLTALRHHLSRRGDQTTQHAHLGFTVASGGRVQPLPRIIWPLVEHDDRCAYATLAATVRAAARGNAATLGLRLALYVERIQLWLWQHAYVGDGWDARISAKLERSGDLKACGWLMLLGCFQAGKLPLLALARLALLAGPRILSLHAIQLSR